MAKTTKQDLINKNEELKNKIREFSTSLESQKKSHEEIVTRKENEFKVKKEELENKIKELEELAQEKQRQLNTQELKKLAVAYNQQEDAYSKDAKRWFRYVIVSFIALFISVGTSIYLASDVIWFKKFEFYLINFIIITFLVFSLKQFSYYVKLRTDYANRKTLSQSYHNILSSADDSDIKPKFLDKATDVLCAKSEVRHESYTLPEKLLETLAEISKNLSRK